jgi:hypothetical protein
MRLVVAALLTLGLISSAAIIPLPVTDVDSIGTVSAQPTRQIEVDIDRDRGGWVGRPLLMGFGLVLLIAIVALVVAVSRGRTTVIKE